MTSMYHRSISFHGISPDQIRPTRRTSQSRSTSVIVSVRSLLASPAPSTQRQLLASTPQWLQPRHVRSIKMRVALTGRLKPGCRLSCYNAAMLVFVFITGCIYDQRVGEIFRIKQHPALSRTRSLPTIRFQQNCPTFRVFDYVKLEISFVHFSWHSVRCGCMYVFNVPLYVYSGVEVTLLLFKRIDAIQEFCK